MCYTYCPLNIISIFNYFFHYAGWQSITKNVRGPHKTLWHAADWEPLEFIILFCELHSFVQSNGWLSLALDNNWHDTNIDIFMSCWLQWAIALVSRRWLMRFYNLWLEGTPLQCCYVWVSWSPLHPPPHTPPIFI